MKQIVAPFTDDQVASLKEFQRCGYWHPFTCCDRQTMEPTLDGMQCPKCGRLQRLVYEFMADWGWKRAGPGWFGCFHGLP